MNEQKSRLDLPNNRHDNGENLPEPSDVVGILGILNDLIDEAFPEASSSLEGSPLPSPPPLSSPLSPPSLLPVPSPPPPPPPLLPLPTVEIIEQPPRRFRFRYASEIRCGGTVSARIKLLNCDARLETVVIVSCVIKDEPYKVHPNCLFGRKIFQGVYVDSPRANEFKVFGIGIRRARHSEVEQELNRRSQLHVPQLSTFDPQLQIDPFKGGFSHAASIARENLHRVRLAFQVFIKRTRDSEETWTELPAIVSDPIYNENAASDTLEIINLVITQGTSAGGDTVIIEVDQKVERHDTEVIFYEDDTAGNRVWETRVSLIYAHQCCLAIKTPPCGRISRDNVLASVVVLRLSNNQRSKQPKTFKYVPGVNGLTPETSQDDIQEVEEEEPRSRQRVQPRARFMDSSDEDESDSTSEEESDFFDKSGLDLFAEGEPDDSSEALHDGLSQLYIKSNDP